MQRLLGAMRSKKASRMIEKRRRRDTKEAWAKEYPLSNTRGNTSSDRVYLVKQWLPLAICLLCVTGLLTVCGSITDIFDSLTNGL